jgi:hypothetical protein
VSAAAEEAVASAVDLGYRVVDEYIRQGQRVAERLGGGALPPPAGDVQDVALRMVQYTSDAFALWLRFVEAAFGAGARGPAAPAFPRGWEAYAAQGASNGGGRIRVRIVSRRAVEVTVDLDPDASRRPLTVQTLRSADPGKPGLRDLAIEPGTDGEAPTLVVRVPDEQPADLYSGIVVDATTGRLAGTLAVRVLA